MEYNTNPTSTCDVMHALEFLNPSSDKKIALVLLNQEWASPKNSCNFYERFVTLWSNAVFKASVDGGTNILNAINEKYENKFIPDLVSGDFDSLDKDLIERYKALGAEIVHTPDQDYTDFTKCIKIIAQKYRNGLIPHTVDNIVCLLGYSNRLDHTMANINTLYTSRNVLPSHVRVCLLLKDSYVCLLAPGKTIIHLHKNVDINPVSFGLLPIGCPCTVSTAGLKSNLNNLLLEFKTFETYQYEFVSNEDVSIYTDNPLVFMLPLHNNDFAL